MRTHTLTPAALAAAKEKSKQVSKKPSPMAATGKGAAAKKPNS